MTPELVDSAMVRFGFLMGPFKMLDLIGMDTVLRIKSEQKWHMSMLLDELVERKMWGRKTGF